MNLRSSRVSRFPLEIAEKIAAALVEKLAPFCALRSADTLDWELRTEKNSVASARYGRDKAIRKLDGLRTRVQQGRCPASRRCNARFGNLHEHLKQHHPRHPWRTK